MTAAHTELVTAKEVGAALRVPLARIYTLAREGRIKSVRLGRAVRFPLAVIVADLIQSALRGRRPRVAASAVHPAVAEARYVSARAVRRDADSRLGSAVALAEQDLVGALMLDPSVIQRVRETVSAADFQDPKLGTLAGLLFELQDEGIELRRAQRTSNPNRARPVSHPITT